MDRLRDQHVIAFARDVAINVIANLVAASIIYLGGVGIGIFPKYSHAIWSASSVILTAGFALSMIGSSFVKYIRKLFIMSMAPILLGVGILVDQISEHGVDLNQLGIHVVLPRWEVVAFGSGFVIEGLILFLYTKKAVKEEKKPRIRGLNWIEPPTPPRRGR